MVCLRNDDARFRDSVTRADCWIVYEPFRVNTGK